MTFLFAYLGNLGTPSGWPVHLMHATEAAFVIVAFVCALSALILRRHGTQLTRGMVAAVAGVSASFGLIMPFELAPFFFDVHGEIMLATIVLILVYPIAAFLFISFFWKFKNARHVTPPPLPSQ